jgi:hypothetical protein
VPQREIISFLMGESPSLLALSCIMYVNEPITAINGSGNKQQSRDPLLRLAARGRRTTFAITRRKGEKFQTVDQTPAAD